MGIKRTALKVWEGLETLERVEQQVKAGTWVQPIYKSAPPVLPEVPKPAPVPPSFPIITAASFKQFLSSKREFQYYDELAKSLRGLKL